MNLIHLSDFHIYEHPSHKNNCDARDLIARIVARYRITDLPVVVITGDVTHDGRADQYREAVDILRALTCKGFTLLIQPGNHDYGEGGWVFYSEACQDRFRRFILIDLLKMKAAENVVMEDLYPMVSTHGGATFIELDSIAAVENDFLHLSRGAIGKRQLEALDRLLDIAVNPIVCVHHHPVQVSPPIEMATMAMEDSDEFMAVVSGRAQVLCFGHLHISNCWGPNRDMDGYSDRYGIEWILSSGKSTDRAKDGKFFYREIDLSNLSMREVKV